MLSLPDKYIKNSHIAKNVFVKGAELTGADKKRFETAVEDIALTYQIEGFDIPNLVNDEYNCQVIMFIRIKVKEMKQAAFIAKIVQKYIKPLCIIEFTDGIDEVYSFADKRLNKQNSQEIIIEGEYVTDKLPLNQQNSQKTLFSLYIDYDTILNRNDKHSFYVEMMTKAFIVFNQEIYSKSVNLLDSKMWYESDNAIKCFELMKKLKTAKSAASKAKTIADKSIYNKQMKEIIKELEELV